jgi:hypothetical protein
MKMKMTKKKKSKKKKKRTKNNLNPDLVQDRRARTKEESNNNKLAALNAERTIKGEEHAYV